MRNKQCKGKINEGKYETVQEKGRRKKVIKNTPKRRVNIFKSKNTINCINSIMIATKH